MLLIRDILVRIRIHGSVPLPYGSWCTLTSVFIDKKSKRSHEIVEIKVLLTFLLVDVRIRIREAQKHPDPDSQHYSFLCVGGILYEHERASLRFFQMNPSVDVWFNSLLMFFSYTAAYVRYCLGNFLQNSLCLHVFPTVACYKISRYTVLKIGFYYPYFRIIP